LDLGPRERFGKVTKKLPSSLSKPEKKKRGGSNSKTWENGRNSAINLFRKKKRDWFLPEVKLPVKSFLSKHSEREFARFDL